ncbi:hypothetical protein GCM10023168_30910 [Fodinibacter luteus]|uniref:Aminoglycoside phosphotransferase domain-containing protein n=1 Tax=Fodinibacter luteus TaxID=552064 RepID=A0ABP8KMF4_9MICO
MTTAWPAAPAGAHWTDLDRLVGLVGPVVEAESRPGGVHQVRWDPERRTRVAFDRADGAVVVVEATPDGLTRRRLRDDVALTGVAEVLDPQRLAGHLAPVLGGRPRGCVTTPVSYRPGSRCVVRCEATDRSGRRRTVYVKVLAEGARECAESHEALAGGAVPVVGCWPELSAVVTAEVPGPTASALLRDPRLRPEERIRLATRLGALLAGIHRVHPGPLVAERVRTPSDELAGLARLLPAAWQADAVAALSLGWVLDRLAAEVPEVTRTVFGHGSFRPGQVVVDGGRLAVLDLDGAGPADPARDLGNAMAHLDWQHLRGEQAPAPVLSAAVRAGYASAGGEVDPVALDWWRAAALLKIAGRRYRSLDTTHWDAVPLLVGAASAVLERHDTPADGPPTPLRRDRLPDLTDPTAMTSLLNDLLGGGATDRVQVTSVETLRVAPGRRIVVRCTVAGAAESPVQVIAKAFAERERAVVTHENLVLFDSLRDPVVRCGTQHPIGVDPVHGVVVCRAADGSPLSAGPDTPAADVRRAVAERLGVWLRTVHATGSGARRVLDVDHEVANAALWAQQVARADTRLRAPAGELAELLAAHAPSLPRVRDSLIHKDLHLGHVLVDPSGGATVIDLDEARMGDPAFDLAHLCAYADEAAGGAPGADDALATAFREAYGPLRGPDAAHRLAFFRAYALLKITRQTTRGHVGDDVVAAAVARLTRGASCLRA